MREIKFRFIFKDGSFFRTRYMTLDELLDSNFALESMEEDINAESDICTDEDYPEYEVFKCQYTGLKDKNGVEIYDGDIVKEPYYVDENNGFLLLEVVFDNGEFLGKVLNKDNFGLQRLTIYREVIGNIYEDSNLLDNN